MGAWEEMSEAERKFNIIIDLMNTIRLLCNYKDEYGDYAPDYRRNEIMVYNHEELFNLAKEFRCRVRMGTHAVTGGLVAQEAAAGLKAHGTAVQQMPACGEHVDIHQSAQGMRILYMAAGLFSQHGGQRNQQIGLVAGFQVPHLRMAHYAAKGVQEGRQAGAPHHKGRCRPFNGSGKLHRKTNECMVRPRSEQILLTLRPGIPAGEKLLQGNHSD